MASVLIQTIKHTCDRCGEFIEKESENGSWYPSDWQLVTLGQTGAKLDLCNECNKKLCGFLSEKGGDNMKLACFKDSRVI